MPWWQIVVLGRHPRRTFVRIVLLVLFAWLIFGRLLLPIRTDGISMQPTLDSGRFVFVNASSYWFTPIQRGDIVAIQPTKARVMYVKRVVGLPGERVAIKDGVVLINGQPLDEPYVQRRRRWQRDEILVDTDEIFVIGDNRSMRIEHHTFGRVAQARVVGRLLY